MVDFFVMNPQSANEVSSENRISGFPLWAVLAVWSLAIFAMVVASRVNHHVTVKEIVNEIAQSAHNKDFSSLKPIRLTSMNLRESFFIIAIWLIGVAGIIVHHRRVRYYIKQSAQIEDELSKTKAVNQARFRNIVEALPTGIHQYALMSDGRLVFEGANPAADRLVGLDHSTIVGKTIEEAFPGLR